MTRTPFLILIPACVALALGGSSCSPKAAAMPAAPPPIAVTTAEPIEREIVEWDEYTGRTEAVQVVEVRARVNGYLETVHFKDGAMVAKGDLLFTIDARPYQATLDQAVAELERARAQLEIAENDSARVESITANGAIAAEEIDQRRMRKTTAAAAVRSAEATVSAAKLDVEYTHITAPIAGRIGRKLLTEGNVVNSGPMNGTLLTTIVSVDPLYCYIDADEQAVLKYIRLARTGERASARDVEIPAKLAFGDETEFTHEGQVDFVDNRIDPTTGTLRGRIVFRNEDGRLIPGLFARVRMPGSGKYMALLVDDQAIGADLSTRYAYVVDKDGIVQYRAVELGPLVDGLRVVRKGLTSKDRVIVNGLARIARPGVHVASERTSMDPKSRPDPAGGVR